MAGKGLEGVITGISKQLAAIEKGMDDIYYGSKLKKRGVRIPGTKEKVNGILPIVQEISKIDLCNILVFLLTNTELTTITGSNTVVGKKLEKLKESARKLTADIESGQLGTKLLKDPTKLKELYDSIDLIAGTIDADTIAVVPQLANAKNYIEDVKGTLTGYIPTAPISGSFLTGATPLQFRNLNTVPSAEVQRVLGKIRGIQSTVSSISNISTAQDVTNLVQDITKLDINRQLRQLQKVINPAQILPVFREIINILRGINQIALKLLSFVRILQTLIKVSQVLLNVLNVISKILLLIPIPNIFTVTAVNQSLAAAYQKIQKFIQDTLKIVSGISALVEVLYSFIVGFIGKVDELIKLIQIIITNLESCQITADSPIVPELKEAESKLDDVKKKLNEYTNAYAKAQANKTGKERVYNGYVLRIEEEDLVDEGIKYKRRRGVAFDSRGVLVAETQGTFATDLAIIYEELILQLKNKGLISDIGRTDIDISEAFANAFTDPYVEVGLTGEDELIDTAAEVNQEISQFINGIKKGGRAFKRKVRKSLSKFATKSAQDIKQSAKSGTFKPSQVSNITGGLTKSITSSTGSATPVRLLSPEERAKWQRVLRSGVASVKLKRKAREVLQDDDEARANSAE